MGGTYWNETTQTYNIKSNRIFRNYLFKFRVILCSCWLGAMIALGIAFIFTATKYQKETNLFKVQLIIIILALLYNLEEVINWNYRLNVNWFKSNQKVQYTTQSNFTAIAMFMEHFIPLLADSALMFRISSFFPFPIYSKLKRLMILGPFYVMGLIRFIFSIIIPFTVSRMTLYHVEINSNEPYPHNYPNAWTVNLFDVCTIAEYSLASLYCIFASSILLFKAFKLSKSSSNMTGNLKIKRKMRFFAEAITMCFIPPIIFNIASAESLLGPCTTYCYFREIGTLNVNVSVVCSLLATSWSTIRDTWSNENQQTSYLPVIIKKNQSDNSDDHQGETLIESPISVRSEQMECLCPNNHIDKAESP